MKLRVKKKFYNENFADLCFDVSLDAIWRERLFAAAVGERFTLSNEDLERLDQKLKTIIRVKNLNFTIFNDGWTNSGFVVFGFSCVEFPQLAVYSTNNPEII